MIGVDQDLPHIEHGGMCRNRRPKSLVAEAGPAVGPVKQAAAAVRVDADGDVVIVWTGAGPGDSGSVEPLFSHRSSSSAAIASKNDGGI